VSRYRITIEEYLSAYALDIYRVIQRWKIEEAREPDACDRNLSNAEWKSRSRAWDQRCAGVRELAAMVVKLADQRNMTLDAVQREIVGWLVNENGSVKSERLMRLQGEVFATARRHQKEAR